MAADKVRKKQKANLWRRVDRRGSLVRILGKVLHPDLGRDERLSHHMLVLFCPLRSTRKNRGSFRYSTSAIHIAVWRRWCLHFNVHNTRLGLGYRLRRHEQRFRRKRHTRGKHGCLMGSLAGRHRSGLCWETSRSKHRRTIAYVPLLIRVYS